MSQPVTARPQPNYDRLEALVDTLDGMTDEEKVQATSWVLLGVRRSVPADEWRDNLEDASREIQRRRRRNTDRRDQTYRQMVDDATHVEWKEPPHSWRAQPAVERHTAEMVAVQLRARPGEWALIARNQSAAEAYQPWWSPLMADAAFEVRTVPTFGFANALRVGDPFDTYARYVA